MVLKFNQNFALKRYALRKYMFIVNPVSANGTTKEKWNEYRDQLEAVFGKFDFKLTTEPRHATKLTRDALLAGYDTIISVGGDGTMNEVANGFFEHDGTQVNPDARLAVFSLGTGCDYIKTLEHKKGIEDVIAVLKRDKEKVIDGCWVITTDATAEKSTIDATIASGGKSTAGEKRFYLNIGDSGLGGATTLRVNQKSKVLKGFLSFLIGALYTLFTYQDKKAKVTLDGKVIAEGLINSVIVANGKYFGGGMRVAPDAIMDDGLLDIVIIHHMSRLMLFKSFPSIYSGNHIKNRYCSFHKGKHVTVETFGDDMLTEIDGEQVGTTSAEFGIIPNSIKVLI